MSGGVLVSGCCGFVSQVARQKSSNRQRFLEHISQPHTVHSNVVIFATTQQNRPPNQTQDSSFNETYFQFEALLWYIKTVIQFFLIPIDCCNIVP
jgi:hypothetical protein